MASRCAFNVYLLNRALPVRRIGLELFARMSASALHPHLSAKRAALSGPGRTYVHATLLTRYLLCAFRYVDQYFDRILYRRDIPLHDRCTQVQAASRAHDAQTSASACAARVRVPCGRARERSPCMYVCQHDTVRNISRYASLRGNQNDSQKNQKWYTIPKKWYIPLCVV